MRLRNILIVVEDIEKSKKFYHDLFGLDVILDNEGNVIYYTSSTISDFSIIINDVCIVSNESINSSDFPVKLNGKIYSEGNIRCLIKAIRSNN